jgi:hypothetical protein
MKKQTKQSRRTARRKVRQRQAWDKFRAAAAKHNWANKWMGLPFEQLSQLQKFAVMRYAKVA